MIEERGGGRRMNKAGDRWEEGWRKEIERRWEEEGIKREEDDLKREVGRREERARREDENRGWEAVWDEGRRDALRDKESIIDDRKWGESEKNRFV